MSKQLDIQSINEPSPSDAIEGIVKAFDTFPIVALGEAHGLQEEADFIAQLIGKKLEDLANAYLYLGPADSSTASATPPETYQDEAYMNELNQRWKLTHGQDPELFTRMMPKKYRDALGIMTHKDSGK